MTRHETSTLDDKTVERSELTDPLKLDLAAGSPLPEIIYQRLRIEILSGLLKPGELLRQENLASRFNSSRVPVREAMSRLEADGLVMLRPRRGYAVTSLDQSEIVEIFELRMVIEEHAGSIAALARTDDDVHKAGGILAAMDRLDSSGPNYLAQWARYNREFHAHLIASTRRKRLTRMAGVLRDLVEPYIRVEAQMTGHVHSANREHRDIFEAYKAGDSRGLAGSSRRHVENTARRLLQGLRERAQSIEQHVDLGQGHADAELTERDTRPATQI